MQAGDERRFVAARVEWVRSCPARAGWLDLRIVTPAGESMQWCFARTAAEEPQARGAAAIGKLNHKPALFLLDEYGVPVGHLSIDQALAAWGDGEVLVDPDLIGSAPRR